MAKRKRRRKTAEIARDRKRIAERYLRGELQVDIARVLHVAQSTVSRDLVALHTQWRKEAAKDISEAKSLELAKIDQLEITYWAAWIHSCEDSETVQHLSGAKGVGKITKTSKGRPGDHNYLKGVQWCIDRRCKILGVDAPVKLAQSVELDSRTQIQVREVVVELQSNQRPAATVCENRE